MGNTSPVKYNGVITIRVDAEFKEALEDVRRSMDPIPSKSDAIRKVIFERQRQLERKRSHGR